MWTKVRRELTTMQMVKQLSTDQSWLPDWRREALAKMKYYGIGSLRSPKNIGAQFIGFAYLSLRGARFLAYTLNRLRNLGGEPNEIATPRQVGARNDRRVWWWINQAAIKNWGRDLQERVSSLVLAVAGADRNDDYPCLWNTLHQEGDGRSWAINDTPNLPGVE